MDSRTPTRPAPSAAVESLWQLQQGAPGQFFGWCRDGALNRVFGGQVAAQALAAAGADMTDGWLPCSLHAYFVREGRSTDPIMYRVDHVDDGRAIRFRRVTASQSDKPIFILDVAFRPTGAEDHLAPPERGDLGDHVAGWAPDGPDEARWMSEQSQRLRFDLRFATQPTRIAGRKGEVTHGQRFWLRTAELLQDHPLHHACALTYVSDLFLVSTALASHALARHDSKIQAASLDHALWFHRLARADDWVMYEQASPTSAGGRGLSTGRLLDRHGEVIATVRQEVLLRVAD